MKRVGAREGEGRSGATRRAGRRAGRRVGERDEGWVAGERVGARGGGGDCARA